MNMAKVKQSINKVIMLEILFVAKAHPQNKVSIYKYLQKSK